jgi:hypothetical protein
MPQAPMPPSRGFTLPGIFGSISGAAFPTEEEMGIQ